MFNRNQVASRAEWIDYIGRLEGDFISNTSKVESKLQKSIQENGINELITNIRLCGNIPESYGHDTTEEKLYSKFTDILLCEAYKAMGLKSIVLTERADVADVEGYGTEYSFVADAKAFRLSRTAKNQKDFKVQAMDRWKHGKPYAMVVCPIYQLPSKSSQIYQQATSRNVCIFTYSHLSLLVNYAKVTSNKKAEELLFDIFNLIETLNPSKLASDYWLPINRLILNRDLPLKNLWKEEKVASLHSIDIGKDEALKYLSKQRELIVKMSHQEAISSLLKASKIESKIKTIQKISDNGLIEII